MNALRRYYASALATLGLVMVSSPAAAQVGGNPIEQFLDNIVDFLTDGVVRSLAILAIIGLGVAALRGLLEGRTVVFIIVGMLFIFAPAEMVNLIEGWTS